MNYGKLRHAVTIQHFVTGSPQYSPSGEPQGEWTDLYTDIAAEWVTLRGGQLFTAQQHHADVRGIWRIHWRTVTDEMRIVHGGLYYSILWVPPFDKSGVQIEMDLECSEGVTDDA